MKNQFKQLLEKYENKDTITIEELAKEFNVDLEEIRHSIWLKEQFVENLPTTDEEKIKRYNEIEATALSVLNSYLIKNIENYYDRDNLFVGIMRIIFKDAFKNNWYHEKEGY